MKTEKTLIDLFFNMKINDAYKFENGNGFFILRKISQREFEKIKVKKK